MKLNIDVLPWQNEFLQSTKTVKALSGASDTGKSWICRLHLILTSLQYPKSRHFATATTWTQTHRAVAEPIIQFLEDQDVDHDYTITNDGSGVNWANPNRGRFASLARLENAHGLVTFSNGSRIELYSSDKLYHRIRSLEYGLGFVEEASVIDDKHIEKIFFEGLRRLRMPNVPHHLLMAMNPDLKTRWLFTEFFEKPPKDSYVKMLTFKDGWNADDKERESKILMGSERQVNMFYHGLWGNLEGQAFVLKPDIHIKPIDPADLQKFYITFDYGFSPDPMVYLLASYQNGIIFILDEVYLTGRPVNQHAAHLEKWYENYNIVGYTGETATGSGEIRDLLNQKRLTYYPTTKARAKGWTSLADKIDLKRLVIDPKCKDLLKGMDGMVWVGSTKGVDCDGLYDDGPDALRYFDQSPIVKLQDDRRILTA